LSLASPKFVNCDVLAEACCSCPHACLCITAAVFRSHSLGWRLAGQPDAPVVLALGGISAHRCVFDISQPRMRAGGMRWSAPGWRSIRTKCVCWASTIWVAAANRPGRAPAASFRVCPVYDQARGAASPARSSEDPAPAAIVGASYGGMVALAFGERHAPRVEQLIVISGADRPHPMATAWRSVQRRIVRFGTGQRSRDRGFGTRACAGDGDLPQPG
jgi:homoserine O-acetyltransferase